jgi:hypothetical protein
MDDSLTCWLTDLSRPEGPYIYRFVSHILSHIRLHIYLRLLIRLHWYEPLCTDTSRSPEAYLHTPTAYQTDLTLTIQVHMQQKEQLYHRVMLCERKFSTKASPITVIIGP